MTKHPTTKEKKRILAFMDEMQYLFEVQNFSKEIVFKDVDAAGDKDGELAATIVIVSDYRTITINIFPRFFRCTREAQRQFLLHEFCHHVPHALHSALEGLLNGKLVTAPQISSMDEEATSRITYLLHGLLTGRFRYARKAYGKYLRIK